MAVGLIRVTTLVLLCAILTTTACAKSTTPPPALETPPQVPAEGKPTPKEISAPFDFNAPPELPIATVGQPYSYSFLDSGNFRGGKAPYTVSILRYFRVQDGSELDLDDAGIKFDSVTGVLSGTPKPGSEGAFKTTVYATDATRKEISKEVTLYIMSDIVNVKGVGKVTATLQYGHLGSITEEAYRKYGDRLPEMAEKDPYELLGLGDVLPAYGVEVRAYNLGQERPGGSRTAKERLVVPHMVGALDIFGRPTLLPKPVSQITTKVSLDGLPKSTALFPNQYQGAVSARATITQDGKSLNFEIAGSGEAGKALYFGAETGDNDGDPTARLKTPYVLKLTNTGTTEQSIDVTFQLRVDRTRPEKLVDLWGNLEVNPRKSSYSRLTLATTKNQGQWPGESSLGFASFLWEGRVKRRAPLQLHTEEVKLQFTVPPGSYLLYMGELGVGAERGYVDGEDSRGACTFQVTGSITMVATISATGEPVAFELPIQGAPAPIIPVPTPTPTPTPTPAPAPLPPQTNVISNFRVVSTTNDELKFSVDYFYDGNYGQNVWIGASVLRGGQRLFWFGYLPFPVVQGSGSGTVTLTYFWNNPPPTVTTDQIRVEMYIGGASTFYSKTFDYTKTWSLP